LLLYVP
jgi:hypothetical protein